MALGPRPRPPDPRSAHRGIAPPLQPFFWDMERSAARTPRRSLAYALAAFAFLSPLAAEATPRPPSILDDYQFQEQMKKGLGYLYDMDFAGADEVFAGIAARYPGHPVSPFLKALVPWWTIQLEPDDTSQDAAFFAAMDEVLEPL